MKKFILYLALFIGSIMWFNDWISSGRMDNFIRQHPHPEWTPKIIFAFSQIYQLSQNPKSASHYYRWLTEDFPDDKNIAEIRYQLGQCYEDMKNKTLALEQYSILKSSFSSTEYGQKGTNRYNQIKF